MGIKVKETYRVIDAEGIGNRSIIKIVSLTGHKFVGEDNQARRMEQYKLQIPHKRRV